MTTTGTTTATAITTAITTTTTMATAAAAVPAPVSPRTPLSRLRWAAADGCAMAHRNVILLTRQPEEVFLGLMLPIVFVLMFGYVFGGAMMVPGGGSYREFVVPGIFALVMLNGVASTGTGVATDSDRGVIDRFRAAPMARSAVVTGRAAADMVRASADMTVLVGCGLLIGWRWHLGLGQALAAIGLVLLLRLALTFFGIYLGLLMPTPDGAAVAVYPLSFPLTVLSNAFVPTATMPGWLATIAEWNPISATVAATRDLFGNPGVAGDSWPATHATLLAVGWPVLLMTIFIPLAVRRYQRLSR